MFAFQVDLTGLGKVLCFLADNMNSDAFPVGSKSAQILFKHFVHNRPWDMSSVTEEFLKQRHCFGNVL